MPKIISVFDDHDSARRALDHLVQAGFHRGDVHIARGGEADLFSSSTAPMQWSAQQHEHHEEQGVLSSIGHALASVFGMDTPDAETQEFLDAVRRGHSVLVVEWADQAQSQRAKQILRDLGALDVKERTRQWHAGWSGDRSVAAPPRDYEDLVPQRTERERADRALAADQGDSERTWGLEGPASPRGNRADRSR